MKKTIAIIAFFCMGLMAGAQTSVWDGSRTIWTRGNGAENTPYLIESAQNLAFLAYAVNKGFDMRGLYFRLATDIDLNGSEDQQWIPIGLGNRWFSDDGCDRGYPGPGFTATTVFRGHFDGGGHTISKVFVNYENAGVFGNIQGVQEDEPAVVENLIVTSGYIQGSCCGGIVGLVGSYTLVSHCWNEATVDGSGDAGGIVGRYSGNHNNLLCCANKGRIIGKNAGGIVGDGTVTIEECYNEGDVSGIYAGGVIGFGMQRVVYISNCYNTGDVVSEGTGGISSAPARWAAGGIAGFLFYGTSSISNCYNVGSISSLGAAGCILAYGNNTILENNYYISACSAGGEGLALSEGYMHTQEFVENLNYAINVWGVDANGTNSGYPILVNNYPLFNLLVRPNDETLGQVHIVKRPNSESSSATVIAEPFEGNFFLNWTVNGQVVSTANPYTFVVDKDIELVGNFQGTGVDEAAEQRVSVSPNPTKNTVNIGCENMKGVSVYTLDGRMAKTYDGLNANAFTLDMSDVPQGIYILRVETREGAVVNRRIVKE